MGEIVCNDIGVLGQMQLFCGIDEEDILGLLDCLGARCVEYAKGDYMIEEGALVYDFGVVLAGHGRSMKWDSSGRIITISLLEQGSEIGVMLAAGVEHKSPVTVEALEDVSVLMISFERVLSRCERACAGHERLLRNFIQIVAGKGLVLHERIDCLLQPSIREKIMTFLVRAAQDQRNRTFSIPMNRNAMAEYLNVERSALSRELSHMKRDGVIDYHKNSFRLLER